MGCIPGVPQLNGSGADSSVERQRRTHAVSHYTTSPQKLCSDVVRTQRYGEDFPVNWTAEFFSVKKEKIRLSRDDFFYCPLRSLRDTVG